MRKLHFYLPVVFLLFAAVGSAQNGRIDSSRFFIDEKPVDLVLTTDLKGLLSNKKENAYQPATVTFRFADSSSIQEEIRVQTRGKFRLANCFMPPLRLNFRNTSSPKCKVLGKLKLVTGCGNTSEEEQLIIKEYLSYRIYNLLTEKSFRVRLLRIRYDDTRKKVKSYTQYGFFLEDVDDMASRNKCVEVETIKFLTESTDRRQMTLVALFEYMIGNTDWSVPNYHNVKLIRSARDSVSLPFVVPYDLNHTGFVNAAYAVPSEELGIESVRERLYRGFPRTMEELQEAINIFNEKKDKIWSLINNCEWLSNRYKKDLVSYLNDFYNLVNNKTTVKHLFIENARKQ
jgi:hypothetical protein